MLQVMNNPNLFPSILDEFFGKQMTGRNQQISNPAVNINEEENAWNIEVAAPGLDRQDFNVKIENDTLTISSEKKIENEEDGKSYRRREFRYASFQRSFILPNLVEKDAISAVYNNGILNVVIPKKEEAKEKPARSIEIK